MIWLILSVLCGLIAVVLTIFLVCEYKDYKDKVKAWDEVKK